MKVTSIKTHKITNKDKDISKIFDAYIKDLKEKSVVAVTSKIVAICEGRLVPIEKASNRDEQKDRLIRQEAQYYLPKDNRFHIRFTIKNDTLIASAGVDESNGNGYYVLWPSDPQKSANEIREYLKRKFSLKYVGVIITDSKTTPMRWGVTGIAIAHSGFLAVKSYIGKEDVFGRKFKYEKLSIRDCLASAAVLTMGEGAEQTPLAVIQDIPNIQFQDRNPTQKELDEIKITLDTDLYGPFLKSVKWRRGRKGLPIA